MKPSRVPTTAPKRTNHALLGASDDYRPAARATMAAVSEFLGQAEAAGAAASARYLGQALSEAEWVVRRGGR